jgi:hypothetical protein
MDERTFARARRAYELGRLRAAAPWAAMPLVLAGVSWTCCVDRNVVYGVGAALAVVVLFLVWRGGVRAFGAKVGLVTGLAAWAAPLACPARPACLVVGLAAGLAVAVVARRRAARARDRLDIAGTAALVAGAAGALGCVYVGAGGMVGIAAGLALGAIPAALVWSPRPG